MTHKKSNIIYGIHAVHEAIKSGKRIEKVFIKQDFNLPILRELIKASRESNFPYQFVPQYKLDKITRYNHQGVVAILSEVEYFSIDQLVPLFYEEGKVPLILILDHITDVRNFGSIARTAVCAGVDALIIPDKGSAMVTPDAVKASSGALLHIPICRETNLLSVVKYLQQSGFFIFAATEKGNTLYYDVDYTLPSVIIMGAEDKGINPSLLKIANYLIKIPLIGNINSLNVSVATGIVLYERLRQFFAKNKVK